MAWGDPGVPVQVSTGNPGHVVQVLANSGVVVGRGLGAGEVQADRVPGVQALNPSRTGKLSGLVNFLQLPPGPEPLAKVAVEGLDIL